MQNAVSQLWHDGWRSLAGTVVPAPAVRAGDDQHVEANWRESRLVASSSRLAALSAHGPNLSIGPHTLITPAGRSARSITGVATDAAYACPLAPGGGEPTGLDRLQILTQGVLVNQRPRGQPLPIADLAKVPVLLGGRQEGQERLRGTASMKRERPTDRDHHLDVPVRGHLVDIDPLPAVPD